MSKELLQRKLAWRKTLMSILIARHGETDWNIERDNVMMSLLTLKNDLDFKTSYTVIDIENAQAIKLEPHDLWETRQKLKF